MTLRASVTRNIGTFDVAVTVVQGYGAGRVEVLRLQPDGQFRFEDFDPGDEAPPTLSLDTAVLAAIVAAASDVIPPSAAVNRHLADSIAVRDRLLSLVEHGVRR